MKSFQYLGCLAVAMVLFLTGCVSMGAGLDRKKAYDDLQVTWKQENEKIALAQGDRVLSKDFDQVYSAFITALSELGLSVKNTERQSGYIYAEGKSVLAADEHATICEQMKAEVMQSVGINSSCIGNKPGESLTNTITVTIQKFNKQTKVKLRLNVEASSPHGLAGTIQYPPYHTAKLKAIWNKVDQQLFMNEHLDK
jgi:hypothetical protein